MKQLACNSEGIATTIESFRRGGIIIFPTDTVYGIGCNPYNEESVDRIYQIKKREKTKLLPVLGYSKNDLEKIVDFDNIANKIIDKFWPGPLTLILPLNDSKLNKLSNYTNNLENFNYNVIIANIYETYNFLNKEVEKNLDKKNLKMNYSKILTLFSPAIPHFTSECLEDLEIKDKKKFTCTKRLL